LRAKVRGHEFRGSLRTSVLKIGTPVESENLTDDVTGNGTPGAS